MEWHELCDLLGVARSGYYAWRRTPKGGQAQRNAALVPPLAALFHQHRGRYGRPRFRPRTTDSRHAGPIAPNVLGERPAPTRRDEVWVTDIKYLPTAEGWLYLAGVMDLCKRQIVGWSMHDTFETGLPLRALQMALTQRGHPLKVVHHSDRCCQYAS